MSNNANKTKWGDKKKKSVIIEIIIVRKEFGFVRRANTFNPKYCNNLHGIICTNNILNEKLYFYYFNNIIVKP